MNTIRILAALAAVTVVTAAPNAASAQASLNGEVTLTACYVPKSGTVYRIKVAGTPDKCAQNHVEFSWTTGGTTSVQVVEVPAVQYILGGGEVLDKEIACPTGTVPISGGFYGGSDMSILASIRSFGNPQAWAFLVHHNVPLGSPASSVTLHVLCLKS